MAHKIETYEDIQADLNKQFGNSMMICAAELNDVPKFVTSEIFELDNSLAGGIPEGVGVVWGPETAGKTAITFAIMGAFQRTCSICKEKYKDVKEEFKEVVDKKTGEVRTYRTYKLHNCGCADKIGRPMKVVYLDQEDIFSPRWAEKLGVDLTQLGLAKLPYAEDVLDVTERLIKSQSVDLIVMDSIAQLNPKDEAKKDMNDNQNPSGPKTIGRAMRRITSAYISLGYFPKLKSRVILINQRRYKLNTPVFVNPETQSGGEQLKHTADWRIKCSRGSFIKSKSDEKLIVGQEIRIDVEKLKTGPPKRNCIISLYFAPDPENEHIRPGKFNNEAQVLNSAIAWGFIDKAGSWYSYKGERIGQGADKAVNFLMENKQIYNEILKEVKLQEYLAANGDIGIPESFLISEDDESWITEEDSPKEISTKDNSDD